MIHDYYQLLHCVFHTWNTLASFPGSTHAQKPGNEARDTHASIHLHSHTWYTHSTHSTRGAHTYTRAYMHTSKLVYNIVLNFRESKFCSILENFVGMISWIRCSAWHTCNILWTCTSYKPCLSSTHCHTVVRSSSQLSTKLCSTLKVSPWREFSSDSVP